MLCNQHRHHFENSNERKAIMADEDRMSEQARSYWLRFDALWDGLAEDLPRGRPDIAFRQILGVLTHLAARNKKVRGEDIVSGLLDEANNWSESLVETEEPTPDRRRRPPQSIFPHRRGRPQRGTTRPRRGTTRRGRILAAA
jgi:hypothetical protein